MAEIVNHPPHYNTHPSGIECIDVVEWMGFNLGNAIKYIWRADEKGMALTDLQKARWYIEREIERRGKHPASEGQAPTSAVRRRGAPTGGAADSSGEDVR
jgi:hypothetical protein